MCKCKDEKKKVCICDTGEEVKLTDKVTLSIKAQFSSYPELTLYSTTTCPINDDIIQFLVDNEILCYREDKPQESYLDYIKWLAQKEGKNYADVLSAFTMMLEISPINALSFLLKTISRKLNENKKYPYKVWIINMTTLKPNLVDLTVGMDVNNIAYFIDVRDALYALEICKPIIDKING